MMSINNFLINLMQADASNQLTIVEQVPQDGTYLGLVMKGGWIMIPLLLMSLIAIYVMIERWVVIRRAGKKNGKWILHMDKLIRDGKIDKVLYYCKSEVNPTAKVIVAGLKEIEDDEKDIQESMQVESRQQIASLENQMNYLSIISSVAPMLGFLGTIFGVIKIFYNISVANDINIGSISDGLYQKMICSGTGLLIGIIAYTAYYLLNGKIDKIVTRMDAEANDVIRAIRVYKSQRKTRFSR